MKEIKIVFGEMGVGKNYWGEILAKKFDLDFFDGDLAAPAELIERIENFRFIPRKLIIDYIFKSLAPEIIKRAKNSKNGVVISQALYRDVDRRALGAYLQEWGFKVQFYWVKIPFLQNVKQLMTRNNGKQWVLYNLFSKPMFQKPTHRYRTLNNVAARLGIY